MQTKSHPTKSLRAHLFPTLCAKMLCLVLGVMGCTALCAAAPTAGNRSAKGTTQQASPANAHRSAKGTTQQAVQNT